MTSASNIEVVNRESKRDTEWEELAVLSSMEFEYLPADRVDKPHQVKPYDQSESKEPSEKKKTELKWGKSKSHPNRAFVNHLTLRENNPMVPITNGLTGQHLT